MNTISHGSQRWTSPLAYLVGAAAAVLLLAWTIAAIPWDGDARSARVMAANGAPTAERPSTQAANAVTGKPAGDDLPPAETVPSAAYQ